MDLSIYLNYGCCNLGVPEGALGRNIVFKKSLSLIPYMLLVASMFAAGSALSRLLSLIIVIHK